MKACYNYDENETGIQITSFGGKKKTLNLGYLYALCTCGRKMVWKNEFIKDLN